MQARDNPFNPLFSPFPRATARLFEAVWKRELEKQDNKKIPAGAQRNHSGGFDRGVGMRVGYFLNGLGQTRWLDVFLEAETHRVSAFSPVSGLTHVAGWGLKPAAKKARRFAAAKGLPYLSLEDGFLRSLGLGVTGSPLHSLIVDHSGIYYDATRPSDLETRIVEQSLNADQQSRARAGMALLQRYRLSKYNHAPDFIPAGLELPASPVLVVDQTAGDASIHYGLASPEVFAAMLDAAIAENPGAEILVKVHPDVVAVKKSGALVGAGPAQRLPPGD